jgi:hypothetical protein
MPINIWTISVAILLYVNIGWALAYFRMKVLRKNTLWGISPTLSSFKAAFVTINFPTFLAFPLLLWERVTWDYDRNNPVIMYDYGLGYVPSVIYGLRNSDTLQTFYKVSVFFWPFLLFFALVEYIFCLLYNIIAPIVDTLGKALSALIRLLTPRII